VLKAHRYRGNIRELRNILSRAVVLTNTNVIDQSVIRQCLDIGGGTVVPAQMSLKAVEEHYLEQLMRSHHNNKEKVAAIAGISVRSLYRKLQQSQE
jgi:DNA-binding NtrC family response regulator